MNQSATEKKLADLIGRGRALLEKPLDLVEQTAWKLDVVSILRDVFGLNSLFEGEFSKLTFAPRGVDADVDPDSNWGATKARQWRKRDINEAVGILISASSQLAQKGLDGLASEKRLIAFLSHEFGNPEVEGEAALLREFLESIGIGVITGKDFQPRSVSAKMQEKLSKSDFGIVLVTDGKQSLWTRDEITALHQSGKEVFFLVSSTGEHVAGIFGDIEYIPYEKGRISETFTKIVQGIQYLRESRSK